MKKLYCLLIVAGTLSAQAQKKDTTTSRKSMVTSTADRHMPGWAIDINLLGGGLSQKLTSAYSAGNYLNSVNVNEGSLKFNNGSSFGFDAQLGYFFGQSRNWGIGAGFMYLAQMGNVTLNNFHAEYEATDYNGNIFRQIVTPDQPIKENIKVTNMNIPLVLKYKKRFSGNWGVTADAGLLFNVQMKNTYNSNASFDYEAAYDIVTSPDGLSYIYDNTPTPKTSDFLITKAFVNSVHPGDVSSYFAQQREAGESVGLNVKPNSNSGTVSYAKGNVGFIFQPSVNYYFTDYISMNLGLYYIYQGVNNNAQQGYQLTNKMGDYSSPLNNVTKSVDQSYGLNLGVRFMFGKNPPHSAISSEDAISPTQCDLADGMIILHGFRPGKNVTVDYSMNGVPQPDYYTAAMANGTVRITNLMPAAYTNIAAKEGSKYMKGEPISLTEPRISITSQSSTNPTANGLCDGTMAFKGLPANAMVTVNNDFNGSPNAPFYGRVSSDNTLVIKGLCAGTYTHMSATIGKCATYASDITLTAPPPPPPPLVPDNNAKLVTTPIYFDIDGTAIHPGSISIVETAVMMMKEDKDLVVTINGYADNTGTHPKNQVLSVNRANMVKKYLLAMGISPDRIRIVAHGDKDPIVSNKTPEGRSLNRCAVLAMTKGVNL